MIAAYERAGFYAYHVAEHHLTDLGMAPSPSVFLAAVAARTTRLRFGPMIFAAPLYHPLRLLQEICMLDQLSGGRLEMGFGRGAAAAEIRFFNVDPGETERLYEQTVAFILEGMRERAVTVPSRSASRMNPTASSYIFSVCAGSTPKNRISAAAAPRPKPMSSRPPLIWSSMQIS